MVFRSVLVALGLMAAAAARADDRTWTRRDTILQGTFTLLVVADWAQTRATMIGCPGPACHSGESPWAPLHLMFGRYPSRRQVNASVAAAAVLHTGGAIYLRTPWRQMWQVGGIVLEGLIVGGNLSIGAGFTF